MAIRVLFDSTEIQSNYIVGLSQSVKPYNQNFSIGNTICRTFVLQVNKAGYSSIPSYVYLYEDNNIYATLLVDDINEEYEQYAEFSLVDMMVMFNKKMTYTTNQTVKQILESVCTSHSITLATQSFYMDSFSITWQEDINERDFISYVAEVNGGYAYINASGNLVIASYSPTPAQTISINNCSSFKLGSHHLYDRVYVELGSATKYYPSTSSNDTLYLNSDNILFNDAQGFTIDGIIQHIHSVINGLDFYNINIEKAPVASAITGQLIGITGYSQNTINTICTVDYSYNGKWIGGLDLNVQSSKQEETQIVSPIKNIKRLEIKVDRDEGRIDQILSDASGHTGSFSLYLNENNPDDVISCINAAADNIILSTKSLIFGDYPSGKYIEAKTWNASPKGMTMVGNGSVHIEPIGGFFVDNNYYIDKYDAEGQEYTVGPYNGNDISLETNTMYYRRTPSSLYCHYNEMYLKNYYEESSSFANSIRLYSANPTESSSGYHISGENTCYITNNNILSLQKGNEFKMISNDMYSGAYSTAKSTITNYNPAYSSGTLEANQLELWVAPMSDGSYGTYARLYNYNANAIGTTYSTRLNLGNRLDMSATYDNSRSSNVNAVYLQNYFVDALTYRNNVINELRMLNATDSSTVALVNSAPYPDQYWGGNYIDMRAGAGWNNKSEVLINNCYWGSNLSGPDWENMIWMTCTSDYSDIRFDNTGIINNHVYTSYLQLTNRNGKAIGLGYEYMDSRSSSTSSLLCYISLWKTGAVEINALNGQVLTLQGNGGIKMNGHTLYFSSGYVRYS